jgi:mono/diheme cytochrome c family protein
MRGFTRLALAGAVLTGASSVASAQAKSPADEAKEIIVTRCNVCHGEKGDGNGIGAMALNPKPRNWSDAKWQKETADDKILKTIVEGGAGVGLSPTMTPNPDLKGKDAVLKEILKTIRGFGAKK